MNGIRSIFRSANAPVVEEQTPLVDRKVELESAIKALWAAPAEYNRATRRRYGMLSKYWRWDVAAFENAPQAPRYIRRHFAKGVARVNTRRGRRERARSVAIARRKGLI